MSKIVSKKLFSMGSLGKPDVDTKTKYLAPGLFGAQEYVLEEVKADSSKPNKGDEGDKKKPEYVTWKFAFFSNGHSIDLTNPCTVGSGVSTLTKWYQCLGSGPGALQILAFSLARQVFMLSEDPVHARDLKAGTITAEQWLGPSAHSEEFQAWWWFGTQPVPTSGSPVLNLAADAVGILIALYKYEYREIPWSKLLYDIPHYGPIIPALEELVARGMLKLPETGVAVAGENELRALARRVETLEQRLGIE